MLGKFVETPTRCKRTTKRRDDRDLIVGACVVFSYLMYSTINFVSYCFYGALIRISIRGIVLVQDERIFVQFASLFRLKLGF